MDTANFLFPLVRGLNAREPHGAFALYADYLLSSSGRTSLLDDVLRAMLNGNPPGFGLDCVGDIVGYYEDEYMPQAGLEPFEAGTEFWVGSEELTYFDAVMYSREELCGWLTLALIKLDRKPLKSCRFLDLMEDFWSPRPCLDALRLKLEGIEPWARGPVGPKFTEADLVQWHGSHVPGFSERYFAI